MIVTHSCRRLYNEKANNRDGVIVGWHLQCDSMFRNKLTETFMFPYLRYCDEQYHICKCEKSSDNFNQPHYIILAEDDRICYVEQGI